MAFRVGSGFLLGKRCTFLGYIVPSTGTKKPTSSNAGFCDNRLYSSKGSFNFDFGGTVRRSAAANSKVVNEWTQKLLPGKWQIYLLIQAIKLL